jgi:hypothetical protein
VSRHTVYAIALTPAELALVVRAVRAHRTDELRRKARVLHMLEHAVSDRDLALLRLAETQDVTRRGCLLPTEEKDVARRLGENRRDC